MGFIIPIPHRPIGVTIFVVVTPIGAHLARETAELTLVPIAVLKHPLVVAPDGLASAVITLQVVATPHGRGDSQQPPKLFHR